MTNIAELLKDCPRGMDLDCVLFNGVEFEYCTEDYIYIRLNNGELFILTKYGNCVEFPTSKCIIFPKDKTTWEGFVPPCQFKDGDIVISYLGNIHILKDYTTSYCFCDDMGHLNKALTNNIAVVRLATETEKQKLFDSIKASGCKWNPETKTLEKLKELTESKEEEVDDEIVMSGIYFDRKYYANEVELHLGDYEIEIRDGKTYAIFKNQETKTLKPKFKVGDTIKIIYKTSYKYVITEITDTHYTLEEVENKFQYTEPIIEDKNWELVSNKFDITTLKPFDKVLVRDSDKDMWCASIFSHTWKDKYFCVGAWHNQCISYEANKELLGTTHNPEEYGSR